MCLRDGTCLRFVRIVPLPWILGKLRFEVLYISNLLIVTCERGADYNLLKDVVAASRIRRAGLGIYVY